MKEKWLEKIVSFTALFAAQVVILDTLMNYWINVQIRQFFFVLPSYVEVFSRFLTMFPNFPYLHFHYSLHEGTKTKL